jgi:glycosyltransferase involved in cell wall biosynthesis
MLRGGDSMVAASDSHPSALESRATAQCDVTVVVPTRDERDNIAPLLRRLDKVRPELRLEVLFVDDSADDTPQVIEREAKRVSRTVSLLHRAKGERSDGLGGAVKAGLLAAKSELVCVMDADLQHPPELLGTMIDEAAFANADAVLASRYCGAGDAGTLSAFRMFLSRSSGLLAKVLFPRRLRAVSDPMSGFFLVRRSAIDAKQLRPDGFKILLEVLLSGATLATSEVPFHFGARHAGHSKASLREGIRYLSRLTQIRVGTRLLRFARFGMVGLVGTAVNTGLLVLLTREVHLWYLVASVVATEISVASNYVLAEWLVFRDVTPSRSRVFRFGSYALINNASLLVGGPLLVLLVSELGIGVLAANLFTLLLLGVLRFGIADSYVWGRQQRV